MTEVAVRIDLQGGTALARDVFAHVMTDAGFEILQDGAMALDTDVVIVVAEGDNPAQFLKDSNIKRAVVVADIDPESESVADLVLSGAEAIVHLQATAKEMADIVRVVAAGGSVIAPLPARRLTDLARAGQAAASPDRPPLTRREIDILQCIGRGQSVKETAQSLGITAKTVENLQSRLFRKLEVRNRAQAFAQAHGSGLLPIEVEIETAAETAADSVP